jgi:DNA-binding XRE family transcriptional regulator
MSDFKNRLAEIIGEDRIKQLQDEAFISTQIIKHRHQKKMSQQDLANAIGVAKSTIGRIEAGLTNPNSTTLWDISRALDAPIIIDGRAKRNEALV